MSLDRRQFLVRSGLAAAAVLAAREGVSRELAAPASAPPASGLGWEAVRAQFDLRPGVLHFASFFLVSHPRPVREAIERFRREIDADPFHTVEKGCWGEPGENLVLKVKQAAASYLGGKPEEVCLTQSTTMGLALVYNGLVLRAGDEIVTTTHDHYSHHESMRLAAERAGAAVRRIALYDRFEDLPAITGDGIVDRIRRAVGPKTRAIGITWVHSSSGLKLPLAAIAAAIGETNARRDVKDRVLLVVDGVHGLGVEDEFIAATGIDVFVAGTHKWMFGPRGTGLVWARPAAWAAMRPTVPTFDGEEPGTAWSEERAPRGPALASWFTPGGFHAFEHEWAVESAFRFHAELGRSRIAERIHGLNSQIKEGLAAMPHVALYTPRGDRLSAGLVGFDVKGVKPKEAVAKLLEKKVIATESPYARPVVRLAAGLVNDPAQVDRALAAVRTLAG